MIMLALALLAVGLVLFSVAFNETSKSRMGDEAVIGFGLIVAGVVILLV